MKDLKENLLDLEYEDLIEKDSYDNMQPWKNNIDCFINIKKAQSIQMNDKNIKLNAYHQLKSLSNNRMINKSSHRKNSESIQQQISDYRIEAIKNISKLKQSYQSYNIIQPTKSQNLIQEVQQNHQFRLKQQYYFSKQKFAHSQQFFKLNQENQQYESNKIGNLFEQSFIKLKNHNKKSNSELFQDINTTNFKRQNSIFKQQYQLKYQQLDINFSQSNQSLNRSIIFNERKSPCHQILPIKILLKNKSNSEQESFNLDQDWKKRQKYLQKIKNFHNRSIK